MWPTGPTTSREKYGQDTMSLVSVMTRTRQEGNPPQPKAVVAEAGQEQKWPPMGAQDRISRKPRSKPGVRESRVGEPRGERTAWEDLLARKPPVLLFLQSHSGHPREGPAISDNRGPAAPLWTPQHLLSTQANPLHCTGPRGLSTTVLRGSSSLLANIKIPPRCY